MKARMRVLYISSALAPIGMLTSRVHSAATAILLIAVMAFVVYSWFINTAAIIPDIASERFVGSILGFVGTAGSAAGALFSVLVGFLLTRYSYLPVFMLAGSMHVAAAIILWSFLKDPQPNFPEPMTAGVSPSHVEAR